MEQDSNEEPATRGSFEVPGSPENPYFYGTIPQISSNKHSYTNLPNQIKERTI